VLFKQIHLLALAAVTTLSACANLTTPNIANSPPSNLSGISTVLGQKSTVPISQDDKAISPKDVILGETDLWKRIRSGFAMNELDNPKIAKQERWYATHPRYMARMLDRSQRYLYYITQQVEKRGMPMEIALLPMIESAFKPNAYSSARASGIWQFIPSTGKHFGLKQNWWYDGRRDIISATNGALDYLQKLHTRFGDWELALAAYNCGEGAVARAQKRNRRHHKPTDFSHLHLPKETRNYVPKLLAVKSVISDPAKYSLTLPSIANSPYFASVSTEHHIDVKLAAELADISLDEFNALNPAHDRPVILQRNAEVILLPVAKVKTFQANLESYTEPLVSWQAYKSKKGEHLDKLASRFGLSAKKLKAVNGFSKYARISNGQTLLVPLNGELADDEFVAFNTNLPPTFGGISKVYIVRRGDTLSHIARRYHVSVASLRHNNRKTRVIHPGQRIKIAGGNYRRSTRNKSNRKVHIVRKGETLSSIGRRYHVSTASLKRRNGNSNLIHPGQKLDIHNIKVASNP